MIVPLSSVRVATPSTDRRAPAAPSPFAGGGSLVAIEDALRVAVEEYGRELGPVLTSTAWYEGGKKIDPRAHNTDGEDSRGALQVNVEVWPVDAAPMPSTGEALSPASALSWWRRQLRAAKPVIDDAVAGARELAGVLGVPWTRTFDLVWQWGRVRALRIARRAQLLLQQGVVAPAERAWASAMAELYGDLAAARERLRRAAWDAAYNALLLLLEVAIPQTFGTIAAVLLLLWLATSDSAAPRAARRAAGAFL